MKHSKNLTFILISFLLLCAFPKITHAQNSRKIIDFNDNWLFEQDDWIGFYHGSWMDWNESTWIPVRTPHTYNAGDTFDPVRGYYRGMAWYRKHFVFPESKRGRILKIHFGAIGNESEIWVNEQFLGKFTTGYTPIEVDITDVVSWDSENVIAIRVNNLHNDEIPPGRWRMDYNVYGGIYREVNLLGLSPIYLQENELRVTTPLVAENRSEVSVSGAIQNTSDEDQSVILQCALYDENKEKSSVSRRITLPANQLVPVKNISAFVKDVELWSPENPKLYTLNVTLLQDGKKLDVLETKIGFRTFSFDAEKGFVLNGNATKLRGLNRHQCYPGLGNAVPKRLQIEDAILLKELGANFVRCAHYPQHVSFLDACDSLGLLVYEEIASWQHIGGDQFIEHMDYMMDGMIRRDRNHPSIIMWGMMNEGRSYKMFEKLSRTARELDGTRPVSYAENHIDHGIEAGTVFQPDVLGLNYNLDKYDKFHELYPHIPVINTEATNADNAILGDLESQLTATFRIEKDLNFVDQRSYISGICIWGFHDYGTNYKPVWPMQQSGVVSEYREFKEAAYFLKARWTTAPFIQIAGHWNHAGQEGVLMEVYVWNNCDKVDLFLNGLKLEKEVGNLWKVPYQPGELKAIGKKGKEKVEYVLRTSGTEQKITCSSKDVSLKADGFDAILVKAQLSDIDGNPVPLNDKKVSFEISGPGKLVGIGGSTEVQTAHGNANILVQSTGKKGKITVTAESDGLQSGTLVLRAF